MKENLSPCVKLFLVSNSKEHTRPSPHTSPGPAYDASLTSETVNSCNIPPSPSSLNSPAYTKGRATFLRVRREAPDPGASLEVWVPYADREKIGHVLSPPFQSRKGLSSTLILGRLLQCFPKSIKEEDPESEIPGILPVPSVSAPTSSGSQRQYGSVHKSRGDANGEEWASKPSSAP